MPSFFQLPNDLVEVTPDGRIHVFDGSRLALVSYDGAGRLLRWAYLPKGMRTALLEQDAKTTDSHPGASVGGSRGLGETGSGPASRWNGGSDLGRR